MTRRESVPAPDDPAFTFAQLAAEAICETWLDGLSTKAVPEVLTAIAGHLRAWPDSQPETCWIVARAASGNRLMEWAALGYPKRQAMLAFAGVLVTMDRALRSEPKPRPSQPSPGMPGKPTLRPYGASMRPVIGRK